MRFDDGSEALQPSPRSRLGRATLQLLAALMYLAGPAFLGLAFIPGADRAAMIVSGLIFLVLVPFGIALAVTVPHEYRQNLRLESIGVQGSAEVLGIEVDRSSEDSRYNFSVWVSAPSIAGFTGLYRRETMSLSIGDVLPAVIDSETAVFASRRSGVSADPAGWAARPRGGGPERRSSAGP